MNNRIIFNAQMANTHRRIKSISGRLGDFIFRTYHDGHITAYYKPKPQKNETPSSQCRANFDAISSQLREITDQLALSILSINYLNEQ